MADSSAIRVADADRELVVQELREHMLAGRLSAEEFEDRVAQVYRAVTRAELDAVKDDLPMGTVSVKEALDHRRVKLRRRLVQESGGAVGVSALCVVIWLASGASGSFWPIWVILATMLPLVRAGWQLLGPAPDHEAVEAHLDHRRQKRLARERRHEHRHRSLPR
jgi:hypothetical protein